MGGTRCRTGTVRSLRALCRRCDCRAADGPIALIVDDLHWADVSALRLFRHLLNQPLLPGVVIAAGLRPTEPLTRQPGGCD